MAEEQRNHISLPHPDSLKRPSTVEEVEKMLNLCKKMVSVSLQWAEEEKCLGHADAGVLQAVCSTILTKVKVNGRMKGGPQKIIQCHRQRVMAERGTQGTGHLPRGTGHLPWVRGRTTLLLFFFHCSNPGHCNKFPFTATYPGHSGGKLVRNSRSPSSSPSPPRKKRRM